MAELGVVFYEGPSLLTGDRIVGIITGLDQGSNNSKTGPIAQSWILRPDKRPMDAVRDGSDDAICGDCALRGDGATNRKCYVTPFFGPNQVYKGMATYPTVTWPELHAVMEGRVLRLGAYGDPAAIPFEVWQQVLKTAASWIGYSHQWARCDQRFKTLLMASVDTEQEFVRAGLRGWRTFRVRLKPDPLITGGEFICPASDEAGHRTTCDRCRLCRGTSSPARSVAIIAHGKPSTLKAYGVFVPMFGRDDFNSGRHATRPIRTLTDDSAAANPAVRRRGHNAPEARDPETGALQPPLPNGEGTGQVADQRPAAVETVLRAKFYRQREVPA